MSKADLYFYIELMKIGFSYAEKFLIILSNKKKHIIHKSASFSTIENIKTKNFKRSISNGNIKKMIMY